MITKRISSSLPQVWIRCYSELMSDTGDDEITRQEALQSLAETLRYRQLGWNHEQSKFSVVETFGISRAEKAFNKRFQPSTTDGIDFKDPGGWGNISLKGPFLDSKLEPLTPAQQMRAIANIQKHVQRNRAVDVHVIDTMGLSDDVFKVLQKTLKPSNARIEYIR